jgi:PRTRC genetic system protein A
LTNLRDLALQGSCPLVAAPRFEAMPDMPNGQRVIVASNGVFVQIKLDWLDCVQRLMPSVPGMPLPYGAVDERIVFSFGVLPVRLIEAFIEQGRQGLPDEVAGALVYSRRTSTLRLAMCDVVSSSPAHIDYRLPALADDETVAVDLHTHGRGAPFWSDDDDRDDRGIKVAGVFGCLHHDQPRAEFRLVLNGMYKALPHPWQTSRQAAEDHQSDDLEASVLHRILSLWRRARA